MVRVVLRSKQIEVIEEKGQVQTKEIQTKEIENKEPAFKETKLPARSHIYPSSNFMRERLVIVPPASFDGAEGSYQIRFDTNNSEFILKFKPNLVMDEPHHIHAYQTEEHGCFFTDDSLTAQTYKKSAVLGAGKWYIFRHKCSWQSEFSEDLGGINPLMDKADQETS
eukprot:jgi/Psemu1/44137/gm1.44137_g